MLGTAMIHAHDPRLKIPAHRVVNRHGMLIGRHHYNTPAHMQELLENEGITIENDQIKNFKEVFWDPFIEL